MPYATHHTRISGVWKKTAKAYVRVGGLWKVITSGWQKLAGVWTRIANYEQLVPVGGIVLFAGTVVPTGWTRVSAGDNYMLIGAGLSFSALATGGSATTTFTGSTNTTGNHSGGTAQGVGAASGSGDDGNGNVSRGSHSHTFDTGARNTEDAYKDFILIKADADAYLPVDAVVLSASLLSDLTNTEVGTNRFPRGAATYGGTSGSDTGTHDVTSSSDGSHRHGTTAANSGGGYLDNPYRGSHSHIATINWDLATYFMGLSAWKATAESSVEENAIIMWEGSTAPQGYELCDGAGGTPDMRDRYLKIVDAGSHGIGGGSATNTASWSLSSDAGGSHNHSTGTYTLSAGSSDVKYHINDLNSHTHSASGSKVVTQAYYALTFIRKIAA